MWGHRIIIPSSLRNRILNELHDDHQGIVKTKALARSYVWFPGIDNMIEETIGDCKMCIQHLKSPTRIYATLVEIPGYTILKNSH